MAETDTTQYYKFFMPHAEARISALGGHHLPHTEDAAIWLERGKRADVAVSMPESKGQEAALFTDVLGAARVVSKVAQLTRSSTDVRPLPVKILRLNLTSPRHAAKSSLIAGRPKAICQTTASVSRCSTRFGRSIGHHGQGAPLKALAPFETS